MLFAQQAAEFYLKGKLIELTGSRLYTYSIVTLLNQVASILSKPINNDLIRCAKLLTKQYIGSRYPDARMIDYDKDDAEDCLRCMEMVMNYV
ncbi:HEPN domain-containing protein [Vulcanisaeta distributa]|uniref:HEPN domain-containing protein n=1 Tax=Vulcanisaeta distributa TaxID=164451 RepID=UPI000A84EB73|nr:HEPN domain-containing protein [Vulcanisaeta distributa]